MVTIDWIIENINDYSNTHRCDVQLNSGVGLESLQFKIRSWRRGLNRFGLLQNQKIIAACIILCTSELWSRIGKSANEN